MGEDSKGPNKLGEFHLTQHGAILDGINPTKLLPLENNSLQDHLQELEARDLSLAAFEDTVVSFLNDLFDNQPLPILTQLERSEIEGFSQEECVALKKEIVSLFQ